MIAPRLAVMVPVLETPFERQWWGDHGCWIRWSACCSPIELTTEGYW
uniref:Uncharacterized protein n=1 Tax=Arundo donax TaxID=35708 RepID=A0A0A9A8L2_ARUDO